MTVLARMRSSGAQWLRSLARSLENPSVSLDDSDEDAGSVADSGMRVTNNSALTISAVWRGVNLVANACAKLPLYVVEGDDKLKDKKHPAWRLLRRRANAETSAYHLRQCLTAHAILQGNGYAYIRRDAGGRPVELLQLLPDRTYPVRRNGRLYYVTALGGTIDDPTSQLRLLREDQVLHIHGLAYDGLVGYPILKLAKTDIGLDLAQGMYESKFFANEATPSYVLEVPTTLDDVAYNRLVKDWKNVKPGLKGIRKPAILEQGMKAVPLSISQTDMQAIENRKLRLVHFANWIGLAPHKLGAEGKSAYASVEEENQATLDEGYDPWLCVWEDECREKLLTESEKADETRDVEYNRRALARVNLEKRGNFYRGALAGVPYLLIDEVRRQEGYPPLPDGAGSKLIIPGNIAPFGSDLLTEPKNDNSGKGRKRGSR